jgi:hypothetical protein
MASVCVGVRLSTPDHIDGNWQKQPKASGRGVADAGKEATPPRRLAQRQRTTTPIRPAADATPTRRRLPTSRLHRCDDARARTHHATPSRARGRGGGLRARGGRPGEGDREDARPQPKWGKVAAHRAARDKEIGMENEEGRWLWLWLGVFLFQLLIIVHPETRLERVMQQQQLASHARTLLFQRSAQPRPPPPSPLLSSSARLALAAISLPS